MYGQFEVSSCVPLPQVIEQSEPILHDDQVGHGGVLHGSLFVRFKDPLSNKRKVFCLDFELLVIPTYVLIAQRKRSIYDTNTMNDDECLR